MSASRDQWPVSTSWLRKSSPLRTREHSTPPTAQAVVLGACLSGCDRSLLRLSPLPSLLVHSPERGERLPDDLVHVVVAIGGEPADEGYVLGESASSS